MSDVSYQPFGPTTGWLWGNSAETSREYDTDGQLTLLSSAGTRPNTLPASCGMVENLAIDSFARGS